MERSEIKFIMNEVEVPDWIVDYYEKNFQSSAGKAVKFLFETCAVLQDRSNKQATKIVELEADNQRLREVLDEIANPIKYLELRAEREGASLNGMMAIQLSESSSYLKGIATAALKPQE